MIVNFACFDFFLVSLVVDAFRETPKIIWFKIFCVGEAVAGRGGACQAGGLALVSVRPGACRPWGETVQEHHEEPIERNRSVHT